jgi:hypothetical protein
MRNDKNFDRAFTAAMLTISSTTALLLVATLVSTFKSLFV